MPKRREDLVVTLYHFQEHAGAEAVVLAAIARSTGLALSQLRAVAGHRRLAQSSDLDGADAVIVGGSVWSVWEPREHQDKIVAVLREARRRGLPVFGICYGMQLLAHAFGGAVARDAAHGEWGTFDVTTLPAAAADPVFGPAPARFPAQHAHNDRVTALPEGAVALARSERCDVQAFAWPEEGVYATQFHPERGSQDYEKILDVRGEAYLTTSNAVVPPEGALTGAAALRARLRESPEAEALLTRWVTLVVLPLTA